MGQTPRKYANIISLILRRYAGRLPKADREDIRQEIALCLFEVGDVPERLAYRIIERRVIDYLRKSPPRMENIDDPDVIRKYDRQSVHFPDYDRQLDGATAMELIDLLPNPHREILHFLFRAGWSEEKLAEVYKKHRLWVHGIKEEGLNKLRSLME